MGSYVLRLICAALVGGIGLSLIPGEAAARTVKLLWGVLMAVCILAPFTDLDMDRLLRQSFPDAAEGATFTDQGEKMAREAMEKLIKQECEAYVMDKAALSGSSLTVDITLDGSIPVRAVLGGNVSPYWKGQIGEILHKDLGIPEENVQWTG